MTSGSILRNALLFALPLVFGNILQQLYTTVDTLVVGNYCGPQALAGVGTSAQPVEVLISVFLGIGTGVSILVSQYVGGGRKDKLHALCGTAVFFVYICGIPMALIGYLAVPLVLHAMQVPADVWDAALWYTRIVLMGTIGNIGYNMNAGIMRGMGDSRASLYFLFISCCVNICLDVLLVGVFGFGISGAAASTTIAMLISWFSSIFYIRHRFPELVFPWLPEKPVLPELRRILMTGLPLGFNNSLFSFGHMAMQTIYNAQGSIFMAGMAISARITGVTNIAITGLGGAATTFSGQNYGAGKKDRLKRGSLLIPLMCGLLTALFAVIGILVETPVLSCFTRDPEVLKVAKLAVAASLSFQWAYGVFHAISSMVNGVGLIRASTVINLMMLWAVRIPSAYLIARCWNGRYAMFAVPISFIFGMTAMLLYVRFSKKWHAAVS